MLRLVSVCWLLLIRYGRLAGIARRPWRFRARHHEAEDCRCDGDTIFNMSNDHKVPGVRGHRPRQVVKVGNVGCTLTPTHRAKLIRIAAAQHTGMSTIARRVVMDWIDQQEDPGDDVG